MAAKINSLATSSPWITTPPAITAERPATKEILVTFAPKILPKESSEVPLKAERRPTKNSGKEVAMERINAERTTILVPVFLLKLLIEERTRSADLVRR